jgi:cardiolipin synthase
VWLQLATPLVLLVAAALIGSVILHKRNERAAIGWVGLILLSPLAGSIAYLLFGINRIRRRAARLQRTPAPAREGSSDSDSVLQHRLDPGHGHLRYLARIVDTLSPAPLTDGNHITPLRDGDLAYPEMLQAIDAAERSILLHTYIFRVDAAGEMFLEALHRAMLRGVEVRVLIDGVGVLYSLPSVRRRLRARGIRHDLFMHSLWPWQMPYLNLRNHQKMLVVDGRIGFAGGMNIGADNFVARRPRRPVRDLHFRVDGPLVAQMVDVFAYDWHFTTGETIDGPGWYPEIGPAGKAIARGLTGGPDLEADKLRAVLVAAVSEARRTIRIVTPYFLPDEVLATTLRIAARRGVTVDIVVPGRSNLPFIDWAGNSWLDELIGAGCRIWRTPPPFDHSKLMVVDELWSFVGSVNWDPRSLSLNFEFNIECYNARFAHALTQLSDEMIARAESVTVAALGARSMPVRLRDGVARLFSPYL